MDYIYIFSLLLVFFLSILFFFVVFRKHRSSQLSDINAPPGSMGYPVIGESLAFLYAAWRGHPEKFVLDRMNNLGSAIFKTSIIGVKTVVFCGPSCNKFLFSNENKLVVAWWPDSVYKIFPSTGQTSSIEEASKLKKLLPQFLNPEALRRYVEVMDSITDKHFSSFWENKDQVVVSPLTKNFTFALACRLFLGFEGTEKLSKLSDPFNALARGIMSFPIDFPGTAFNRAIKASEEIRTELKAIIRKRKVDLAEGVETQTQNILHHMLVACDEKGQFMNESEIADKILALLLGGHDTASSVCTSIVKFLAQFPQLYDSVYQEQMEIAKSKGGGESLNWKDIEKMKYSWNVACEAMRLEPPLQGAFRQVIQDFSFHGFSIPKGWKVYWSAYSTHQNPDYFEDPYKFDPTRFDGKAPAPFTFVPFGGGPRMCPGREYARLEILVFMHHLVKRYRWEMVIPGEKMTFNPLPMPSKGLPIRLLPHKITT